MLFLVYVFYFTRTIIRWTALTASTPKFCALLTIDGDVRRKVQQISWMHGPHLNRGIKSQSCPLIDVHSWVGSTVDKSQWTLQKNTLVTLMWMQMWVARARVACDKTTLANLNKLPGDSAQIYLALGGSLLMRHFWHSWPITLMP